jgi:hypothetical protein
LLTGNFDAVVIVLMIILVIMLIGKRIGGPTGTK